MEMAVRRQLEPVTRVSPAYLAAVVAALALFGYGLSIWVGGQLGSGLGITGMNAPNYWGGYIVNFVFFVGLSAGGIIVSALVHALNMQQYRTVARIAEVIAIACILMAAVFITLDVGRPDRIWHLLRYGRLQSPLLWDVIIIGAYLLMAWALGYFSTRADMVKCMRAVPGRAGLYRLLALGYVDDSAEALHRDQTVLRALAIASIPAAVLLHSITAWIMGLTKAIPGWHTALLAPVFVGSALASGLALVILVSFASQRLSKAQITDETIASLGRLLLFALPVLGYFLFSELLTAGYSRDASGDAFIKELVGGGYAVFFWFDLLVGLVAPLLILAHTFWLRRATSVPASVPRLRWATSAALATAGVVFVGLTFTFALPTQVSVEPGLTGFLWSQGGLTIARLALVVVLLVLLATRMSATGSVALASLLVVAGVLAERINIVLAPQLARFSPQPDETFALPYNVVGYQPTLAELSIIVGVYALGILGYLVFAKIFPLVELPEGEESPEPRKQVGHVGG